MPLSASELIYVFLVIGSGSYALLRTAYFLRSSEKARIKRIEQRRGFESVNTSSPVQNPTTVARERGVESVASHFSVLRRLLIPIIAATTILLAAVPFIAGTSASSASILAAVVAVLAGVALRPFLENAIAGLVISSSGLVRIGDTVRVDNLYGTVEDITATHTTVKLWDWRRYLVPNSRMLESSFFNYSLFDTYQWAYVEFFVAPEADLDAVCELAVQIPQRSPHFSGHETPRCWIISIEKDAVCCWLAAWADSPSGAWALTDDVRRELLRELRQRGIPLSMQRHRYTADGPKNAKGNSGPIEADE